MTQPSIKERIKRHRKEMALDLTEEWGVKVLLIELGGTDADRIASLFMERKTAGGGEIRDIRGLRTALVYPSVYDPETRNRVFDSEDETGEAPTSGLQEVFDAALKLNGMDDESAGAIKKDLKKTPGDGSSAVSPSPGESPKKSS